MALFNSFKFGDVDSKDYGVYISGDSVYDSPARSVDLVQVPGRNGALALDNGYYENIEVTYPAGSFGTSQEEWREKMLGIRNALAAQRGYQKLIDTYHPEHYRLGMFFAGISASPVQYNRAGQFPIRFNCKPQRFLISGDEAVEFTAEGQDEVYGPASIASFEAEVGAEIRELTVNLEPVQSGTGDPSPTNVRPISGHTEVNVTRTGKNLLGGLPLGNAIVNAVNNQTYASLGADGDGNYVRFLASSYIDNKAFAEGFFKPNTRYTLILKIRKDNTSSNTNLQIRYTDGSSENPKISGGTPYTTTRTIVFTTAANKTIQSIGTGWYSGATYLYYDGCGIFEGALTADAYEPYAGQTYPIPLGQTVYGGTLDVVSGVLTVDRAMATFDGSEAWTKSGSALNGYYIRMDSTQSTYPAMRFGSSLISDKLIYTSSTSQYFNNYGYCYADGTIGMNVDPSIAGGNTLATFKTWLAANPTQFVYYLVTPTTVQLTPTQVSTLLEQNNIWADAGTVEVKVASPVDLTNPTNFPAKPLIRVYGNGSVRVGNTIATVQNNADGYVDIDCESMNCYDPTGGRNADVSFSGNDFPELASGDNGILLTGPSKVEITPRWWEL